MWLVLYARDRPNAGVRETLVTISLGGIKRRIIIIIIIIIIIDLRTRLCFCRSNIFVGCSCASVLFRFWLAGDYRRNTGAR